MKLSISNIGWQASDDLKVYALMQEHGYSGLEIAPTRIFPMEPYENLERAAQWSQGLKEQYGFSVPSMQSIWYGRQENIFQSAEERQRLIEYTKKAVLFAESIGCENLVFGCPRNRTLPEGIAADSAISFFKEIGDYAAEHHTVIGMEANPTIYNTNYINNTKDALSLIQAVASDGFRLNLDIGTMVQNDEDVKELDGMVPWINHIHISEPYLKPIEKRALHTELAELLKKERYSRSVSIEMGKTEEISVIEDVMSYVESIYR